MLCTHHISLFPHFRFQGKAPKRKRNNWIQEKLTVSPTLPPFTEEEMRALEVKSKVDAQDANNCWAKAKVLVREETGLVITYVGFKKEWDTLYLWEDHAKLAPPESRVQPPPKRIPKKPKVEPPPPPPKIDRGEMWNEVERRQKEKGARSSYKATDLAGEDERWELHEEGRGATNVEVETMQDVHPGEEQEVGKPAAIWDMAQCSGHALRTVAPQRTDSCVCLQDGNGGDPPTPTGGGRRIASRSTSFGSHCSTQRECRRKPKKEENSFLPLTNPSSSSIKPTRPPHAAHLYMRRPFMYTAYWSAGRVPGRIGKARRDSVF